MSKQQEAMRLALVALEWNTPNVDANITYEEAITALRAALAEPEQEPVEWLTGCPECGMDGGCDCPSGTWNPPQRKPLTINEVEQILAQHSYEIHGDRARYIVRMTEEAHGIKGDA